MSKNLLFILVLLSIMSCRKRLDPAAFSKWVKAPENGFCQSKHFGELDIKVQYKPLDYMVALEVKREYIDQNKYESLVSQYDGLTYFELEFSLPANPEVSFENYAAEMLGNAGEATDYLSSKFQSDIYLVSGLDTIKCVMYQYERMYNTSRKIIHLGFPLVENTNEHDITLVIFSDKLQLGPLKFGFPSKIRSQAPLLKLS